jgi:plastocyanin
MAASTKTIRVYQDAETKVMRVDKVHVSPGDQIVWDNQTGSKIDILIPDHGVSKVRHIGHGLGKTPSHQQVTVESVPVNPAAPASYHYAIYVHGAKDFAIGGSHPVMIVP